MLLRNFSCSSEILGCFAQVPSTFAVFRVFRG